METINGHCPPTPIEEEAMTSRPSAKKAVRKKAAPKAKATKAKSDKLVCRYCGSADLSPSFKKRRDRRCRKCFKKRFGGKYVVRKAEGKEEKPKMKAKVKKAKK